jgi:hypothetical protein
MRMGVDDIGDRPVGHLADGGKQAFAADPAAAGVDHGDALSADHETDIGDGAEIGGREVLVPTRVHIDARRDLLDRQRDLVCRGGERAGGGEQDDSSEPRRPPCGYVSCPPP